MALQHRSACAERAVRPSRRDVVRPGAAHPDLRAARHARHRFPHRGRRAVGDGIPTDCGRSRGLGPTGRTVEPQAGVPRRGRRAGVDGGRPAGVRADAAARRRSVADGGPGARDETRPPDHRAARVRHGSPRRTGMGSGYIGGAGGAMDRRDRLGRWAGHIVPRAPRARPRRDRPDPAAVRERAAARCTHGPASRRPRRLPVTRVRRSQGAARWSRPQEHGGAGLPCRAAGSGAGPPLLGSGGAGDASASGEKSSPRGEGRAHPAPDAGRQGGGRVIGMGTAPSAPSGQSGPSGPSTTSPGDRTTPRRFDAGTYRIVAARVAQTKERIDASRVGHVQRRFVQADLANQAMILAALALSLLLPVLVTLAALVPLGAANSLPAVVGARLGLHPAAVADLQSLFPSQAAVRSSSTVFGTLFTLLSAYAWPTALQRGYEIAWGVTSQGWRGLWRPLAWLTAFVGAGAVLLVLPRSGLADPWRTILLLVLWTPIIFVWSWWTQHFLLRRAVGWRLLIPGAIAMTIGLVGLRAFAAVWLSSAISYNASRYGPLGIVFMLLTWLTALSVVMLGGPVLGAALHERRVQEAAAQKQADRTERVAELREKVALVMPKPRARDEGQPAETPDET